MSCTKEEIERKRLAALQRRQNNNKNSPLKPAPLQSTFSPSHSTKTSSNRSYHPYAKPAATLIESSVPPGKVVSGTIYLISEDRFEVNPSEFCAPLINVFKSLPSKNYDPASKLWNFSMDDYESLISKVSHLAPHIVLGPLPSFVLKVLREPTVDPNSVDLAPVEATLRNKLMPFQEEGVRFCIAKRGCCMLADDMGLGKTFQALAVASYYRQNWPLLIVTTSSMRETWQTKIHELLPSVPMMSIVCLSSHRDTQAVADKLTDVVICSYKLATTHHQLLKDKKFGVVIIDESHQLKCRQAACTRSLSALCRGAPRRLLLSGTPALSRPSELYSQLSVIQPGLFSNYVEYGKRYCAGKLNNFGWDMSGCSNLTELKILLSRRFLIRRTKSQAAPALTPTHREAVYLDQTLLQFSTQQRQELSSLAQTYTQTSTDKHAALLSFFSESARVKMPAVCKYIRQVLADESTAKFLIFAHHKTMIDALCETLDEVGTHYICIVGSTPTNSRAELVDKFQTSVTCRAAVLSVTAANAGLTLTAARLVLFAELHWNPAILTQAESRAHRIGQEGAVCSRYLLAPGTVDDFIWPLLQGKLNVLNEVGLCGETFENATTSLQESRNNITQYLSPSSSKNVNDYIPGTNIRKNSINCDRSKINYSKAKENSSSINNNDSFKEEDIDKSFFEDMEGDELLAGLDL
ncbi:SWI/SNF-related matrix-associated actin-dependent regulator of chromatin subfamily A-like protein 1 [Plutella xylostella]|uniref:SWI/SNF-related matrix-associated actin-dependent regulator of chromatin subfamily A-like protein 1 n=1 Tax=Plutella xylostella TaxID=51655 RepID=UPI002032254B|nr:SWI/SNF-related matrix-associated actin-dependent regulator of chromatin subfamily A-like protein 1 [Plutella xylostella]